MNKIASSYANNDELVETDKETLIEEYTEDIINNHTLEVSKKYNTDTVRIIRYEFDDMAAVWNLTNDYILYYDAKDRLIDERSTNKFKGIENSDEKVAAFENACENALYDDYYDFIKPTKDLTAFEKGMTREVLEENIKEMEASLKRTLEENSKTTITINNLDNKVFNDQGIEIVRNNIKAKERIIKKLMV